MGFSQIRPTERGRAFMSFAMLGGILGAYMVMLTVRDAVFLLRLPVSRLPMVYLGIAAAATLAAWVQRKLQRGLAPARKLSMFLMGAAACTAVLWGLVHAHAAGSAYVLYIWVAVFGTLSGVQAWLAVGQLYTIEQAKRLYGFIGLGSVVGGLIGSAAAAVVARFVEPAHLLLGAAAIMVAVAAMVERYFPSNVPRQREASTKSTHRSKSTDRGAATPYVRRLAALAVISGVVVTMGDYWFKVETIAAIAPEDVTSFLGAAYAGMGALSLVAQLLVTPILLRRAGALKSLWVLPLAALVAATMGVFGLGLIAATFIKAADGGLRHTVDRTAGEILQLPIPAKSRAWAKQVIDISGRRSAQAVGALLLLLVSSVWGGRLLVPAIMIFSVAWFSVACSLRPQYLALFRQTLRANGVGQHTHTGDLDLPSVEALVSTLNSDDDIEVITAMELLAEHRRSRLIPALILHHPSPAVVGRALGLFVKEGRSDFLRIAQRLLTASDPAIRVHAIVALTHIDCDLAKLERASMDSDAGVRATALVASAAFASEDSLAELADPQTAPETRRNIATAIGRLPHPSLRGLLSSLLEDPDAHVREAAAGAAIAQPDPSFVDSLIELLAERQTREASRQALVAIGEPAFAKLASLLSDESAPARLRLHAPRSLSRFEDQRAARVLVDRLPLERNGGVHFKILRALAQIERLDPYMKLDRDALLASARAEVRRAFELLTWRVALPRAGVEASEVLAEEQLLLDMLQAKERHAVERALRCLGLASSDRDFLNIIAAFHGTSAAARSTGQELVEQLVEPSLRGPMVALVQDAPDRERLLGAGSFAPGATPARHEVLEALRRSTSESLRGLAELLRVEPPPTPSPRSFPQEAHA